LTKAASNLPVELVCAVCYNNNMKNKTLSLRKALIFFSKFIIWIYLFYLFLAFVIIPLGAPWVIRSQGSKLLKHPVKVRAVLMNPFLLRFNINGFAIEDNHKQTMVGFDKFWVDFSFTRLFKKELHFEALGLDGLQVNVVLLDGGHINLLDLVPASVMTQKPPEGRTPVQPPTVTGPTAKPLPLVVVDTLVLKRGRVSFADQAIAPGFKTVLSNMDMQITGISTKPDAQINLVFQCAIDNKGMIKTQLQVSPFLQPIKLESLSSLDNYALQVLTPYVGKYTGHAVKDGKLDIKMNYTVANNQLKASHKILVQSFDFGDKVQSKDALNLPFGLALALLEDAQNRIKISLPVTGDISKPDFHYFNLIGQVFKNFFLSLITKPFAFLGSMVGMEGGSEELGSVRFLPGQVDLSDPEKEKLNILVKALRERPKLSLEVKGSYDAVVDWKAIKTDVFNQDFGILRKGSRRLDSWVYQELYQRRFGIRALWKLTSSYRPKDGVYDNIKIDEEIKRQLIADGNANKVALSALASGRAKMIYDFIVAAGFDVQRIHIGEVQESQSSFGFVPLELILTVFDNSSNAPANSLLSAEVKK
jgi:hypothetical protein